MLICQSSCVWGGGPRCSWGPREMKLGLHSHLKGCPLLGSPCLPACASLMVLGGSQSQCPLDWALSGQGSRGRTELSGRTFLFSPASHTWPLHLCPVSQVALGVFLAPNPSHGVFHSDGSPYILASLQPLGDLKEQVGGLAMGLGTLSARKLNDSLLLLLVSIR